MHSVVVTRVHLPEGPVRPERGRLRGDIEDGLEGLGDDVVAHQAWAVVEIEGRRPGRAEVPARAGGPAVRTGRLEERTDLGEHIGQLVVAEERRATTATTAVQRKEDEHRVAAHMVVRVAPVRAADGVDAVAAVAVARVRESDPLGQIRRRERERPSGWQQRVDLRLGQRRPDVGARGELDKAPGELGERGRRDEQRERDECEAEANDRLAGQGHSDLLGRGAPADAVPGPSPQAWTPQVQEIGRPERSRGIRSARPVSDRQRDIRR